MRMAPEGTPFISAGWVLVALSAWAAARWGGALSYGALTVTTALGVWLLVFFRDPSRPGPRGDGYVIAPADGRIVSVAAVDESSYLHAPATRISIFMNVFDVHVNRYPSDGRVAYRRYHPGRFLNAAGEKASQENEQSSVGLETSRGRMLVRQIAGLVARRIVTDHDPGHAARQGARMGLIRFGSRVDVFLPLEATVRIREGERTRAGQTVVAEWPA